jgi:KaiC/GvpD/RAD55 family RecA-like ATPase
MQFLFKGAKDYCENGIYVSFAESEDTIHCNMSKLFERNLKKEKMRGKVKILDLTTVTEKGLSTIKLFSKK